MPWTQQSLMIDRWNYNDSDAIVKYLVDSLLVRTYTRHVR